jgi:phospholipid/cholesterol/gamma-HCH transport system substrate-binding protein
MKDRVIGYIVIAILICFLVVPIIYLLVKGAEPVSERIIVFGHVRSLSLLTIDDPVRVLGVEVGKVRTVTQRNDSAFVTVELRNDLRLYGNYTVNIVAKGLMGDRYLTITPGDERWPPVGSGAILTGTVNVSPDDALSYINELRTAIRKLLVLSEELKNGTAQKQSLIVRVRQFAMDLDSITASMTALSSQFDSTFSAGIDSMTAMLDSAVVFAGKASTGLPAALSSVTATIATAEKLIDQVDRLMNGVDSLLTKVNNPDLPLWKKGMASTEEDLKELRKLLRSIQYDTLTLPVKLW